MTKDKVNPPDRQLGYLLTQVSFLKQRIINAELRELDITYMQFIILAGTLELSEENKIVTQQTIASERRLDKAMVSNVVKTLIEKNLILRETHPGDKRAYTLRATAEGIEKALKGKQIALKVDTGFFAGIDQENFREALEILLEKGNSYHEE